MRDVRRRVAPVVAATLAVLVGGCGGAPQPPTAVLRAGFDTLDGTLAVWPARGALAGQPQATAEVSRAVADWRSPAGDRVYLPASGILWLGEIGGRQLALVAASVPGTSASWLLQLTGTGAAVSVERAVEYPDPGYLVYADVLPVALPDGRHYLTSARVEKLTGPSGTPVATTDGLTDRVDVPACAPVQLTATLRETDSLPNGKAADRLVDLGTGIESPRYPMISDESGTALTALDGLDTCALAADDGPFGSVERRITGRPAPQSVPASWPIDRLTTRPLGEVSLSPDASADLDQISWRTDEGIMTSVVLRRSDAAPVASPADRYNPLQSYDLTVADREYLVLVWRAAPDNSVSVPAGMRRLVDRPGLVVVDRPAEKRTFSLATPDKTYYRSAGG
ncbi:hypothetical protein [Plantactinospora sp. GCM10030261]|uniref:hypothetical protein n=1 Tax=Plantactinospora sp. GCM10030261 TaxID=3273420 RepID=UPI0036153D0A